MGRMTNPQPWRDSLSEELFEALEGWIKGQSFDLTHRRWLVGGASGSYAAVVRKRLERGGVRGAILKLLPPPIAADESRGVTSAEQHTAREFYAEHLVHTTSTSALSLPGWWLHLQEVAQVDVARLLPLSAVVDDPAFGAYCETIVSSIVLEWNPAADDPDPLICTPATFLTEFLATHLAALAEFTPGVGGPSPKIRVPGRSDLLPHPMALVTGGLHRDEVEIFRGNTHGDLHLDNILVPVEGVVDAAAYRLIDIGRFSRTGPVSRDPMKLLLSIASAWLPALAGHSAIRSSLAELIVAPAGVTQAAPTAGYVAVARGIHSAAGQWGTKRHLAAEWRRQNLVVLVGSALRTVANRTLPMEDRWWHFEVAALATRAFLEPSAHLSTPPTIARTPAFADAEPIALPQTRPAPASQQDAPRGPAVASRPSRPRFSGLGKVEFCRRLAASWPELADVLRIPGYESARAATGEEARFVWDWLEVRGRLGELPSALDAIDRADLAQLFEDDT